MLKTKTVFLCGECGAESPKWAGKCPSCQSWNTLEEVVRSEGGARVGVKLTGLTGETPRKINEISADEHVRIKTGIGEFDRALGGGIVPGSLILLSGDPGIGKSTMLLQVCDRLPDGMTTLYVSGEESASQIKLRAGRLGVDGSSVFLLNENDVTVIVSQIERLKPDLIVIDSIQTIVHPEISSSAGSIVQVREATNVFMHVAKQTGIPVFLIGHVNKDGAVAGPKVMEHIVDAVLYFEGERNLNYRILRTIKNRFGSTNEIGVFDMTEQGLCEVSNPSSVMLEGRPSDVSGSCVGCIFEGTRTILTEVQALVSRAGYGSARRMTAGFDYNRCVMLIAVLEKRCGLRFSEFDVYLNVIGGLRMEERAGDLTVCLALVSGLGDRVIQRDLIAFGEVGLAGELRGVQNVEARIGEAQKLGFKRCIIPYKNAAELKNRDFGGLEVVAVKSLPEAIGAALGS